MEFRKANENDINKNLLNLYIEGYNLHYNNRKDIFAPKDDKELKENLFKEIENSSIYILTEKEVVIGYAAIQYKNRATKSIWIDEIIIDKNNRHKGYGKYLIDEITKVAKENDCARIELNCWSFNTNALKFYDNLGFKDQRIIYEKKI